MRVPFSAYAMIRMRIKYLCYLCYLCDLKKLFAEPILSDVSADIIFCVGNRDFCPFPVVLARMTFIRAAR